MGKHKQGFNWKARQKDERAIDDTQTRLLVGKVDVLKKNKEKGYDDSNALVLPSKKRSSKKSKINQPTAKLLSKKRRKHLEKVVDKKKKKAERSDLLSKLENVKANDNVLEKLTSISEMQTKGLKRHFAEEGWKKLMQDTGQTIEPVEMVNEDEVTQPKRIKLKAIKKPQIEENLPIDSPNVLGFTNSSSESSDEESLCSETDIIEETIFVETDNHKKEEKCAIVPSSENESIKDKTDIERKNDTGSVNDTNNHTTDQMPSVKLNDYNEGKTSNRKNIPVDRTPEVQETRNKLPIINEEQPIMETINENPVTLLVGETGSGKTTQVPQFLYEAGYSHELRKDGKHKLIGVTEPRRVAAMSMSERVSYEMNMKTAVSYQIRFEGNVGPDTRIKFMTDGILLREMEQDFLLSKYSVIVIDEAHERSYRSDILIGFLSRIVRQRLKDNDPLKLIIMSATLNLDDFIKNEKLFKISPPVVKVDSRQYEVTCHYNKHTPEDISEVYIEEAFRKISKIHRTLPEGGILVFVTGQNEVKQLVKKLNSIFPNKTARNSDSNKYKMIKDDRSKIDTKQITQNDKHNKGSISTGIDASQLPKIDLDNVRILPMDDDTAADLSAMQEDDDLDISEDDNEQCTSFPSKISPPLWTLPLYSLLSSEKQSRVFEPVPEGHRLCVVATNVAETSLTIPGVKYVVDTGKQKTRMFDKVTGVTNYVVTWISKASANQRAGRAGRQSSGHCYRLYSSAVFEHEFPSHSQPEIKTVPLEELVIQMKAMNIDNVINFPFPTPPDSKEIRLAERNLLLLGALQQPDKKSSLKEIEKYMKNAKITPLGRAISLFPLAPRFAKMLVLSGQHGSNFMQYTITMVAALSMQEVLVEIALGSEETQPEKQNELNRIRRSWAGKGNSLLLGDPMILIRAVGAAEYEGCSQEFCEQAGLRHKAVCEIRKLRNQLTNKVNELWPKLNVIMQPKMNPPTDQDAKLLRQIILAGTPDQIAKKVSAEDLKDPSDKSKMKLAYRCGELAEPVFLKR